MDGGCSQLACADLSLDLLETAASATGQRPAITQVAISTLGRTLDVRAPQCREACCRAVLLFITSSSSSSPRLSPFIIPVRAMER